MEIAPKPKPLYGKKFNGVDYARTEILAFGNGALIVSAGRQRREDDDTFITLQIEAEDGTFMNVRLTAQHACHVGTVLQHLALAYYPSGPAFQPPSK